LAWLFFRLPPCWAWLSDDVPAARGLAVAWLKRGVSATKVLELGVPATVLARRLGRSVSMAAVMIGVDPHKASHTAVVISVAEEPLGELRVRACAAQAERLLAWAAAWPQRTWAVEGAGGLGHLLAQQLLAAGERVLDVPPKLGARVRLLAAGNVSKNDPNDARSVAVAALRSAGVREVRADDHAAVLKIWSKRYRDLDRTRTQVACRLHAVLCQLIPGGVARAITAAAAARLLESILPAGAVEAARCELAAAFLEDLRGIDARIRETRKKLAAAVISDVRDVSRFPGRDHFAAYNGTAPIEVSSGPRKIYRLSRRGNRRLNHAIHMAAVTQIGHRHSHGRAYYDKKLAEGHTPKEALRSLKRQISNAIFACLQADARRAAARAKGPGGQQGNDSAASAAGSHPRHRLFGQATPGPGHHPTTGAGTPAPGPARARGRAGPSSIAATMASAQPRAQVERPQRSEDERPAGAARRRPHSAARKAQSQGSTRKPQRPKGTSQAAKNTGGVP
jgi:transposase